MKSPFPGMDPYLEAHWGDVHQRLVIYAADALQPQLPRDLRARVEERVFVDNPIDAGRSVYPDVRVVERPRGEAPPQPPAPGVGVAEPLILQVEDESVTEGYIEIREIGRDGRVITVIEFFSPGNKYSGPGQDLYRQKQREMKAGRVNLVEIDLVRSGERVFLIPLQKIPKSHRTPHLACVWRASRPFSFEDYRLPLEVRLPAIGIPLRENDPDVALDLQAVIDRAYENGAYDDIDYSTEPDPRLDRDHATWADGLLRDKGLRPDESR